MIQHAAELDSQKYILSTFPIISITTPSGVLWEAFEQEPEHRLPILEPYLYDLSNIRLIDGALVNELDEDVTMSFYEVPSYRKVKDETLENKISCLNYISTSLQDFITTKPVATKPDLHYSDVADEFQHVGGVDNLPEYMNIRTTIGFEIVKLQGDELKSAYNAYLEYEEFIQNVYMITVGYLEGYRDIEAVDSLLDASKSYLNV